MRVVGAFIGARRGRLGLLAVVIALTALLSASASGAATARAKGIDVSNWNGAINWSKVAHAGYRFAFAKATEGTGYTDKTYAPNRNRSESAGLVFGAYHFAQPAGASPAAATVSAIKQANHFLAVAGPQPGELPPVLDLEATGHLPKKRLLTWTLAWLGRIEASTGVQPFLYTSPLFWKGSLGDSTAAAAAGTGLWIAHWTSKGSPSVPAQNWNGGGWRFWQWTNCLSVPGIDHCTDGDRMNGANLASVEIQPYQIGLPLLSTPPTIVGPPQAGQLLPAPPPLRRPPPGGMVAGAVAGRGGGRKADHLHLPVATLRRGGRELRGDRRRDRRVVPAGHRRRRSLPQGPRHRRLCSGHGLRGQRPDCGRLAGGQLLGRPSREHQAAANRRQDPGRAGPDELRRDLDRLAEQVHVSLAALQCRRHLMPRDPARDGPTPHA